MSLTTFSSRENLQRTRALPSLPRPLPLLHIQMTDGRGIYPASGFPPSSRLSRNSMSRSRTSLCENPPDNKPIVCLPEATLVEVKAIIKKVIEVATPHFYNGDARTCFNEYLKAVELLKTVLKDTKCAELFQRSTLSPFKSGLLLPEN